MTLSETEIIQRYFHKNPDNKFSSQDRDDVAIGIGDDAAGIVVPEGMHLLSAIDTVVEGVHFPHGLDAGDIGYRVLAVNLSDLAAMGGQPAWALLSLSLPSVDEKWLASFCTGFFSLANGYDVELIGGDLVKGPLVATITLMGFCPSGSAITRSAAQPGDLLFVTGSPGAAALSLQSILGPDKSDTQYAQSFCRPQPRIVEGIALRGLATAMIDISDGLLTDTGRIAAASNVQICLDARAVEAASGGGIGAALSGGDDYELCFTVPADKKADLAKVTTAWDCGPHQIGHVRSGSGVIMPGYDLAEYAVFDHFASE